jgi:hypothetical protein
MLVVSQVPVQPPVRIRVAYGHLILFHLGDGV